MVTTVYRVAPLVDSGPEGVLLSDVAFYGPGHLRVRVRPNWSMLNFASSSLRAVHSLLYLLFFFFA